MNGSGKIRSLSYGSVKALIESPVSGESRKPPGADVITTYCLPFLPRYAHRVVTLCGPFS